MIASGPFGIDYVWDAYGFLSRQMPFGDWLGREPTAVSSKALLTSGPLTREQKPVPPVKQMGRRPPRAKAAPFK